jgi:hypothetical protein
MVASFVRTLISKGSTYVSKGNRDVSKKGVCGKSRRLPFVRAGRRAETFRRRSIDQAEERSAWRANSGVEQKIIGTICLVGCNYI